MRKHATIAVRIFAILGILAGIVSRCSGQTVEEIGTYPVTQTNAVTLRPSATFPVVNEVDPISQRLTITAYKRVTYAPVTKQKTRRFKIFARKVRRIFRPNSKA